MLSIIIPVFNVDKYIEDCLDSVNAAIKHINAEVIIIDDGSTDNSAIIAKKYADNDNRFKYKYQKNQGVSAARNRGLRMAKGKYIGFVDPDDIVKEGMYNDLIATAENQSASVASCRMARFDSEGTYPYILYRKAFNNIYGFTGTLLTDPHLLYDTCVVNKVIRRDHLKKIELSFPEDIRFEDLYFALILLLKTDFYAIVDHTGYLYRKREGNDRSYTQHNANIENLDSRIDVLQRVLHEYVSALGNNHQVVYNLVHKMLIHDMVIFINKCAGMDDVTASEFVEQISHFIDYLFANHDVDIHSPMINKKYELIGKADVIGLKKCLDFERKYYRSLPVDSSSQDNIAKMQDDYLQVPPNSFINKIVSHDSKLIIYAHAYYPRLEISKIGGQKIKAFLMNDRSCSKIKLDVKYYKNERLTVAKGAVHDTYNDKVCNYNYDGTGYIIEIDFDALCVSLDDANKLIGKNRISINYENKFFNGCFTLYTGRGGVMERCTGIRVGFNDIMFETCFDESNLLMIDCYKI